MTRRPLPAHVRDALGGVESVREAELLRRVERAGLPKPVLQYRIIPTRRYRWDAAFPEYRVAVELQGGVWRGLGHNTGHGVTGDAEKSNLAQLMGWLQITVTPDQVQSGKAIEWIAAALQSRGWSDESKRSAESGRGVPARSNPNGTEIRSGEL